MRYTAIPLGLAKIEGKRIGRGHYCQQNYGSQQRRADSDWNNLLDELKKFGEECRINHQRKPIKIELVPQR